MLCWSVENEGSGGKLHPGWFLILIDIDRYQLEGDGWSNTLAHTFSLLIKEVYLKKKYIKNWTRFSQCDALFSNFVFFFCRGTFNDDVIYELVAGLYHLDF